MKEYDEDLITEEKLLKPSEVAEFLNISRAMSYRLLQSGKIPAIRINRVVRVKPSDLKIFIEHQRMVC
jgi:excisionase family DNA binding protein